MPLISVSCQSCDDRPARNNHKAAPLMTATPSRPVSCGGSYCAGGGADSVDRGDRRRLVQLRWFQIRVQFNDWIDDIQQHASHRLADHSFISLKFTIRTNGLYLGEDRILLRAMLDHQIDNLLRRLTGHRLLLDIDSCLASDSMADVYDRTDLQLKGRSSPRPFVFGRPCRGHRLSRSRLSPSTLSVHSCTWSSKVVADTSLASD